jgi:hypothetical protein
MEHQHKTAQKPTMNAGMSQHPPFSICSPSIFLIDRYPLVISYSLRTGKWPIEIVDLPIKNGGSFQFVMLVINHRMVDFPIKNGGSFPLKMMIYS